MKILFIQKRILLPANTGGRIRSLNVLKHLARWHEVTYLCNVEPGNSPLLADMRAVGVHLETVPFKPVRRGEWRFYRDALFNLFSRYPFTVAKNFDPALKARAEALLRQTPYDLVICDFVQLARHATDLRGVPKALFQHNVEAQILRRHARNGRGLLWRRFMAHQWRKMRRFESVVGRKFDAVIAVSQRDKRTFERDYGWRHVSAIDTAVDVEHYQPNGAEPRPGHVVFLGSMDWPANEDGVRHFVDKVWPGVRRAHPEARFTIVGRNPSAAVRRLAGAQGIEVTGTVPDVRPYLAEAAVVVVPLLVGGGTRIKIFEAMAMARPVVSTTLGAEGLPVVPGEHLVVEDEPGRFSAAVSRLLRDGSAASSLGERARTLVCRNYTAETVAGQFDAICRRAVEEWTSRRAARASDDLHLSGIPAAGN